MRMKSFARWHGDDRSPIFHRRRLSQHFSMSAEIPPSSGAVAPALPADTPPIPWAFKAFDTQQRDFSVFFLKSPVVRGVDPQFAPLPDDFAARVAFDNFGLNLQRKRRGANDEGKVGSGRQGRVSGSNAAAAVSCFSAVPVLHLGKDAPDHIQRCADLDLLSDYHEGCSDHR